MVKRIILFVIGGLLMFGLFGCSKAPDVKNKELTAYAYSRGGGMTGGENPIEVFANTAEELSVPSGRLAEGVYTLYAGDYSAEFEIRIPVDN